MTDVIAVVSAGMKTNELRLASISQNLANLSTPGYKRQIVTSSFAQHIGALPDVAHSRLGASASISLDASPGPLRHTGTHNDLSIEGVAFFELQGRDGPVYTRQGSLRLDLDGRLVGAHGLPVAGVAGPIQLANLPFTVQANGDVLQGERVMGTIRQVAFENASMLEPLGHGLYAQGGAQPLDRPGSTRLRSGFLEGANVNSPQEMVRLTETVRHYEALTRIVQGYDEILEKVLRKLGEF